MRNLPATTSDDVIVHPRDQDLVLATHGRSFFVLDDITPLQQLSTRCSAKSEHLFRSARARFCGMKTSASWHGGGDGTVASEESAGRDLSYLPEGCGVRSGEGSDRGSATAKSSARSTAHGQPGVHRVPWDLKSATGARVAPGTCTVRLAANGTDDGGVNRRRRRSNRLGIRFADDMDTGIRHTIYSKSYAHYRWISRQNWSKRRATCSGSSRRPTPSPSRCVRWSDAVVWTALKALMGRVRLDVDIHATAAAADAPVIVVDTSVWVAARRGRRPPDAKCLRQTARRRRSRAARACSRSELCRVLHGSDGPRLRRALIGAADPVSQRTPRGPRSTAG